MHRASGPPKKLRYTAIQATDRGTTAGTGQSSKAAAIPSEDQTTATEAASPVAVLYVSGPQPDSLVTTDTYATDMAGLPPAEAVLGKGDSCRCYHCGGGLRNWETGDDPWKEHTKCFPGCGHVFLAKGGEFIAEVRDITDNPSANDQSTLAHTPKSQQDDSDNVYDPMESVPALSCLQMGCARNLVEMAIQRYVRDHGNSGYSATDLMRIVLSMEEDIEAGVTPPTFPVPQSIPLEEPHTTETYTNPAPEEAVSDISPEEILEELKAENYQLKQRQICKICLDAKASVIFLPCGHMVSCPLCAPALVKCPICKVYIRETVKAYLTGVN